MATTKSPRLSLADWTRERKAAVPPDPTIRREIEERARNFTTTRWGLSGQVIDRLFAGSPVLVPVDAWGGELGWRGAKRFASWKRMLGKRGVTCTEQDGGCLIRGAVYLHDWVPHPYAPPAWSLGNADDFDRYHGRVLGAHEVARTWYHENQHAIHGTIESRLAGLPVTFATSYTFAGGDACIDIAIHLASKDPSLLRLQSVWKGQATLVGLVTQYFPDAISEYRAPWLGSMRLDIFIPSIQVAIEYQGEQHFRPVEFFGGEEAFKQVRLRDRKKRDACRRAGVILIEWTRGEDITPARLRGKLTSAKVAPLPRALISL